MFQNGARGAFKTRSDTYDTALFRKKIVKSLKPLFIFEKKNIIGVWQGPKYASIGYFCRKKIALGDLNAWEIFVHSKTWTYYRQGLPLVPRFFIRATLS